MVAVRLVRTLESKTRRLKYGLMPTDLCRLLCDEKVSGEAWRVACTLLTFVGPGKNECRPSEATIEECSGVDRRHVRRALRKLEQIGAIDVVSNGRNVNKTYVFKVWVDEPIKPRLSQREARKPAGEQGRLMPEQAKQEQLDPVRQQIHAVLSAAGVKGANLSKMTKASAMTLKQARQLAAECADADNPGALMWKKWDGGWRGDDYRPSSEEDFDAKMGIFSPEEQRRREEEREAEGFNLPLHIFKQYRSELLASAEAYLEHHEKTEENAKAWRREVADPRIAEIRREHGLDG